MSSDRSELRCEQVIASWAIFGTLFGLVWAVESFGWVETLAGGLGAGQMLVFGWRVLCRRGVRAG